MSIDFLGAEGIDLADGFAAQAPDGPAPDSRRENIFIKSGDFSRFEAKPFGANRGSEINDL